MSAIRTVAIVENRRIATVSRCRDEVVGECRRRGIQVQPEVKEDTDLVIAIGGDGTLLRAASCVKSPRTLLYGIKHGKVGFLTNAVQDVPAVIGRLASGQFSVSPRVTLAVKVNGKQERCLNEAVFHRASCRICSFSLSADGKGVMTVRADGLIVATPTGSTAHLLAAGGPVLLPEMDAFAAMPIAAHTLACRPVVLPSLMRLTVSADAPCVVVCDGQREYAVSASEPVTLCGGEKIQLVLEREPGFFEKLSEKFHWEM